MLVQLLDFGMNAFEHLVGVFAFLQQHDSLDHVIVSDELAVLAAIGFADLAEADLWSLDDSGHVGDVQGCPVLRLEDGSGDVVG